MFEKSDKKYISGFPAADVFQGGMLRQNWPTKGNVILVPNQQVLAAHGSLYGTLHLPGATIKTQGRVTGYEQDSAFSAKIRAAVGSMTLKVGLANYEVGVGTTVSYAVLATPVLPFPPFTSQVEKLLEEDVPIFADLYVASILDYLQAVAALKK